MPLGGIPIRSSVLNVFDVMKSMQSAILYMLSALDKTWNFDEYMIMMW